MASSTTGHFVLVALFLFFSAAYAQLADNYYAEACPTLDLPSIVGTEVNRTLSTDPRMGASILRLFFHDCFVLGCDGSVLLNNDTAHNIVTEKDAGGNKNSLRGFDVIDRIKAAVEATKCKRVVSCADILAVAARQAVVTLGGPSWTLKLGRRDSTNASLDTANRELPGPGSSLGSLITAFQKKGLSATDLTALSGAHTIGTSQCRFFRNRIYTDTNIDMTFATTRKLNCSPLPADDGKLAPLDEQTQFVFDNAFYKNLLVKRGLLHSDQELFNGGSQDDLVRNYTSNSTLFFTHFANAMVKLSEINPLTGKKGEIRVDCSKINSY